MRDGILRRLLGHRALQCGLGAVLWLVAALPYSVPALNWEGHDGFFHEALPIEEVTEGVPPPITKPLPSCAELRRKHQANSYEQVALPGMNCAEKKL
jgi:hypothetical protein